MKQINNTLKSTSSVFLLVKKTEAKVQPDTVAGQRRRKRERKKGQVDEKERLAVKEAEEGKY